MLLNTTINLLSKQKRKRLEHLIKFIFVRDILEIVLLIYTLLAIVLLWSWLILQEDFNNLAESASLVNREYSRYNQEIREINRTIKNFNQISQYYLPISPQLSELITSLPIDIKINYLEINRSQNKIILSGTALTRSALLQYQEELKKINWLTNIEVPTSQLFQKENINFEVKAQLKNLTNTTPKNKSPIVQSENE